MNIQLVKEVKGEWRYVIAPAGNTQEKRSDFEDPQKIGELMPTTLRRPSRKKSWL